MILLIVDFGVNAVFMPLMLRYLRQYFRWYRWTWEELQLPLEERKAQYRAKKLEEKQKRRAEREAKREAKKKESTASGGAGFFSKNSAQPAAKTVKTQADRRAELENLKKLYDEGLIDEEEYKKARKKALGI